MDHVAATIDKHTISLFKECDLSEHAFKFEDYIHEDDNRDQKGLGWYVNVYLDACHSGSILSEGTKWADKYQKYEESDSENED